MDVFSDVYLSYLKPGERYTLLWPGGKYATWAWGSAGDHLYRIVGVQDTCLVLPGGSGLSFTVEEGEQPPESLPMEMSSSVYVGNYHYFKIQITNFHWHTCVQTR